MKKILLILLLSTNAAAAQPYVDAAQVTYQSSPGGEPKEFKHMRAQVNVPIIFKDSSILMINPIWEERWLKRYESSSRQHYRGMISWFSFSKRLGTKWETMLAFIPRFNGEPEVQFREGFQAGGVLLFNYKKRPGLTFKFGGYYNSEFFGPFFWPLLGIDWKINNKQRIFAILPSYATYEYRINKKLSWGGNFRTYTNSYKVYNVPGQSINIDYTRFNDNQAGAYMDIYLTPKIVANAEGGYSITRRIESATSKEAKPFIISEHSGVYFRLAVQYRLRFD
ncbi:MAG TPA: DUF6268 family outer membrane beta-barrel protein [Chitinophagaceae bacterium]|nr:DUF6268 family outer membrane beta-barrel protein [Chitinophagaceae bacterium]